MINAPTNLTAILNERTVTLNWQDNSDNEGSFVLWVKHGNQTPQLRFSAPENATTLDYGPLDPGQYEFWIQAVEASGQLSDESNHVSLKVKGNQ